MLAAIYFIVMFFFGSLLIASFVLGELVEWGGELVEDIGNAIEAGLEALPFIGDVELTGDIEVGGIGFGLFRSIMAFATFFGGGGYLALTRLQVTEGWSIVVGLATGGIGGAISFAFFRFLATQEVTSAVSASDYVGKTGMVTVSIRPGSAGAVSVSGPMGLETLTACAEESISTGSRVEIVFVEGGIAYVKKAG